MELSFSTPEIREICEEREAAVAALGSPAALDLSARLAEIEASETFGDLFLVLGDQIETRMSERRAIILSTGFAVVFGSGGTTVPKKSDGTIDWERLTRMRIVSIERHT